MLSTSGHKASQPGLRGHSHDSEQDLMKRYVLVRVLPTGGKLWLFSADNKTDATVRALHSDKKWEYRVIDQFAGNAVVWDSTTPPKPWKSERARSQN